MVTIRLFTLDGFTLVRFEDDPPPESSLWTDLGALTLRPDELAALLAQVELENARVTAGPLTARPDFRAGKASSAHSPRGGERMTIPMLSLLVAGVSALAGETGPLWEGKTRTDRSIVLEVTLDAPPPKVFQAWTTSEGLASFFGPKSVVEPRVGGAYTLIFNPANDPEGESTGTKGARILRFEAGRALAFEWIPFVAHEGGGPALPPYMAPAERNARPLPTWVEISLEPLPENRTHLKLVHYGFRRGGAWEASYSYFTTAWATVVSQLIVAMH